MLQAGGKIHGKSESSVQRWVGSIEKWREARISPRALLQEGLCPSVGCWLPPKEAGYGQCGFVGLALFGFMWPETLPVWYRHLVKTNNSSVRLVLLHIWKRNNNDSFDDAIDDWIWRGVHWWGGWWTRNSIRGLAISTGGGTIYNVLTLQWMYKSLQQCWSSMDITE